MSSNIVLNYLDKISQSGHGAQDIRADYSSELIRWIAELEDNNPSKEVDYAAAAVFFKPLILHHWQLHRLRQVLQHSLHEKYTDSDAGETAEALDILKKLLKIIKEQGMSCPYEETRNPPIHHFTWWCQFIQTIFKRFNDMRLGGIRLRRLGFFVGNFLNSEHFSLGPSWTNNLRWLEAHGMLPIFAYMGWLFFFPRLLSNLTILAYHVCNDSDLKPLEVHLDRVTRLRAHWMRIWPEVINDLYWFTSGIILCFFFYGVMSPATIAINLATQIADLFCAIIRAIIEARRWRDMEEKFVDAPLTVRESLKKRIVLEEQILAYMVLHFLILLIAMCMVLPSMALINPLFPVIGGICAVVMTVVSSLVRWHWDTKREKLIVQNLFLPEEKNRSHAPDSVQFS